MPPNHNVHASHLDSKYQIIMSILSTCPAPGCRMDLLVTEEAQKIKIAKYSNLLIHGDTFSALPFEVYGTTSAATVKHLRKLAEAVISERDGERATKRQVSHLLHSWRSLISVSLLEGRAKVYAEAETKREEVATGAVRCNVAQRDRWAVGHHKHRAAVAVQGQHVGLAAVRGMSRWGVVVRG